MSVQGRLGTLAVLWAAPFGAAQTAQELRGEESPASFSWGDFDADGLLDAFVVTPSAQGRLLRNRGDGTLEDVTEEARLADARCVRFGLWQDLDRDLDLDLFVATLSGRNQLLINQGNTSFADATEGSGLAPGLAQHAGFVDYDRDALPDLHLQTEQESLLYHNLGGALFERVELALPNAIHAAGATTAPKDPLDGPAEFGKPAPSDAAAPAAGGRIARTPVPPVELDAPMEIGGLPPGGTAEGTPFPACALALKDQDGSGCLSANSIPTLGQLYPISANLFVAPATGRVGLGTLTPGARLHVAGSAILGDTDVRGQLDLESGGLFEMYDNTGASKKVELHPDNAGGASLSMRNEAGNTSFLLDSDWSNLGDARILMQNGAGMETIDIDGGTLDDAGELNVTNAAGSVTIQLDGNSFPLGTGAAVELYDNAGLGTVRLEGDPAGLLTLGNFSGLPRVLIDGGAIDGGAEIDLMASDGSSTVLLNADTSGNNGGSIDVRADTGETTIELTGDNSNDAGRIDLWNKNGVSNDNSVLISARDSVGTGAELQLTATSGSSNVTIDLDGQNGSTGQLQINEIDGSAAFRFLGNDLDLYNAGGTSTINFDRVAGTKSAVVDTPSYGQRLFYAMEAPEVWFEDFGSAWLADGEARIALDPIFLESVTIDAAHPIKVFVTPDGPTPGLYVEKGLDHFVVREQPGGSGAVGFDWRVVAKRKGLEALRLDPFEPSRTESDALKPAWTSRTPVDRIEETSRAPEHAPRPARSQERTAPAGADR